MQRENREGTKIKNSEKEPKHKNKTKILIEGSRIQILISVQPRVFGILFFRAISGFLGRYLGRGKMARLHSYKESVIKQKNRNRFDDRVARLHSIVAMLTFRMAT